MTALYNKLTNEIISLAVLALMIVAIVAAQVGTAPPAAANAASEAAPASEQVIAVEHNAASRSSGG